MENWGLITFRETSILFDPNENSPANRESISETVAHELAHMWFGNLGVYIIVIFVKHYNFAKLLLLSDYVSFSFSYNEMVD